MIKKFHLSNGISVATYKTPALRSFHLRLIIKGGSLGEDESNNGLAHFMEHMLVQGIPSYPTAQSLSEYIESLAGSYGAFTTRLNVSYSISVPITYTEEAVKIASEVFFHPLFPQEAIEKERNAVLSEIKQKMDSHWYKFNQYFIKNRYKPGSPLRVKTVGSIEAVKRLTREDIIKYWETYFVPKNMYIIAQGNIDDEKFKQTLEKYFNHNDKKNEFIGYPQLSRKDFSERLIAIRSDNELKVNYLDLTFPCLSMTDDLLERVKQNIAIVILGRLRSSRLFKLLRYDKGLLYDVSASDSQLPGIGFTNISAEVSSENLEEVVKLISYTLADFVKNGPTKEELEFTKNYISNIWLMSFDDPDSISDWMESELLWKDKIRLPEDYIKMIKNLNPKDLLETIQKHWDIKKLNLIIQGPIEDSKENKEKFDALIQNLKN